MVEVRILGSLEVRVGGTAIEPCPSRRAWALLAWLALHPGEHARGSVAARFWPDVLDSAARGSLRSAVWALRRALGPDGDHVLLAERDRIALAAPSDLAQFEARVAAGDVEGALALERGPLLADLDDDWVLEARDAHAERVGKLLAQLADSAPSPQAAVEYARRRVALDPTDERAVVELMARLAAAGDRAGALVAYERLCDRLRASFGLAPAAETRAAAEQLRARARADGPLRPSTQRDLVGRADEIAQLQAVLDGACAGTAAVVLLSGEAGIGKSSLTAELLSRARAGGARTATATAPDLSDGAALGLWAELVGALARELPAAPAQAAWVDELAVLCPGLPGAVGRTAAPKRVDAPPELARARLSEAMVELCEHATSSAPLVLAFEDVHLADAASLDLVAYVARRGARLALLIVLTRRPSPRRAEVDAALRVLRGRGVTVAELELAPLPRDALDELVARTAELDARARDRVVTASDGNPLLAIEGARAAARDPGEAPAGLRATVRSAVDRLGAGARRVADLAAVAGRPLQRSELVALSVAADEVVEAAECGLLVAEGGRVEFRHALLREAAYDDLPDARRRALHEQLAGALQARAAERAHHLRLAGRDDLAVAQLAAAARDARDVGALAQAGRFLDDAIALRGEDPTLRLQRADVAALRGERATAQEHHRRGIALLDPGDHEALAAAWLSSARWYRAALCDPPRCGEDARRAWAALDAAAIDDGQLRAEALALLCWAEAVVGDAARAEALLAQLRTLIETLGRPPLLLHDEAIARGHLLLRATRWDEAYDAQLQSARWAAIARRPDMAYAGWMNAACAAAAAGDFERALRSADAGLAAVGHVSVLAAAMQAARAHVLARLGRSGEARAAVAVEREHAEDAGDPVLVAQADADAGQVLLAVGDLEQGVASLEAALCAGARIRRPEARLRRADALARLGRDDEAEAELRATVREPVTAGDRPAALVPRMAHVQGLVARLRGDHELARRHLEEAAAGWRRLHAGDAGDEYVGELVDLGRPPVAGLLEPARELDRVLADLQLLEAGVA